MGPLAEKAMAYHSSTFAWKIPWTEERGRLQSMGLLRVRHDRATSLSLFTFMHWRGNDNPLQCSCLENPRDRGAWRAAIYGVLQSRTRLKRLSSSSSISSLEKRLFRSLAQLLISGFFFFFFPCCVGCMSCLFVLEINPLSVDSFGIIPSHSEGFLFTLFIVSFIVQKLLS